MTPVFGLRETKNGLSFDVQVTPHASRAGIMGIAQGLLKVKVTAPPVEGAANEALIALLSKKLGLKKNQITIFSGARGRKKTILVSNIGKAELEKKIQATGVDG